MLTLDDVTNYQLATAGSTNEIQSWLLIFYIFMAMISLSLTTFPQAFTISVRNQQVNLLISISSWFEFNRSVASFQPRSNQLQFFF